jgi:hypothetical protein
MLANILASKWTYEILWWLIIGYFVGAVAWQSQAEARARRRANAATADEYAAMVAASLETLRHARTRNEARRIMDSLGIAGSARSTADRDAAEAAIRSAADDADYPNVILDSIAAWDNSNNRAEAWGQRNILAPMIVGFTVVATFCVAFGWYLAR